MTLYLSIKYLTFITLISLFFTLRSEAQQLKLGNHPTQINKAAILELESPNQGLRLTRADTSTVNAVIHTLSPAQKDATNGMIIFQTKDSSLYLRSGGTWQRVVTLDSIGMVSLNGLTNPNQNFKLTLGGNTSGFSSDPQTGLHTLNIANASTGVSGVVSQGLQTWDGAKRFKHSIGLESLPTGSIPFIGKEPYNYLSTDSSHLFWDRKKQNLGIGTPDPTNTLTINSENENKSGLTLEKLTATSPVNKNGKSIGVDGAGKVVRVNTAPTYYNRSGNPLNQQVTKILIDSITGNSVAEIKTINIPISIGFNKIVSVQLTAKIAPNKENPYGIVANIVNYNTSQLKVRIIELLYTTKGSLLNLGSLTKGGIITTPQQYQPPETSLGFNPQNYTVYYKIEGY